MGFMGFRTKSDRERRAVSHAEQMTQQRRRRGSAQNVTPDPPRNKRGYVSERAARSAMHKAAWAAGERWRAGTCSAERGRYFFVGGQDA